ncbi:MAG: amino acid ABC transporter permease [Clostridiaceae bacterium]
MFERFGIQHILPYFKGAGITLLICFITALLGMVIGTVIGVALTSKNRTLRNVAKTYVNIIRGIPLLVIMFSVFFILPMIFKGTQVSRQIACVASLTLYAAAYIAELVRGSIQSIPKGQTEAANALGMTYFQRMAFIIMPQAVRLLIPPLVGFLINLVKESSLVSIINYVDLTRTGKIIGNLTMNPLLSYTIVAAFYFAICFSISRLAHYCEKKMQINHRVLKGASS